MTKVLNEVKGAIFLIDMNNGFVNEGTRTRNPVSCVCRLRHRGILFSWCYPTGLRACKTKSSCGLR